MIDPDFKRARQHAVDFGPLPVTATPRADILDGDFDNSPYVLSPLAALKMGRELERASLPSRQDIITVMKQHIICDATGLAPAIAHVFLCGFENAADVIVASRPTHDCTCMTDMERDAYSPGGPYSGQPLPPACRAHVGTPPPTREHWSIEQLKRIIIAAMVEYGNTKGMSVAARRAADLILSLLRPGDAHRRMAE